MCNRARIIKAALSGPIPKAPGSAGGYLLSIRIVCGRFMDRLNAIQTYVRVVESGSFSAAARELGIGQSAVSKQIAALEARVGAELIWRSSRTLSVTEAGKEFYESSVRLLEDFDAAISRVQQGHTTPKGAYP